MTVKHLLYTPDRKCYAQERNIFVTNWTPYPSVPCNQILSEHGSLKTLIKPTNFQVEYKVHLVLKLAFEHGFRRWRDIIILGKHACYVGLRNFNYPSHNYQRAILGSINLFGIASVGGVVLISHVIPKTRVQKLVKQSSYSEEFRERGHWKYWWAKNSLWPQIDGSHT